MSYSEIVTVVFECINVGIIAGLGFYVFYTKMLPGLRKAMKEKQAVIPKLEQELWNIHNQESNIDNAIVQQAAVAEQLKKKIMMWVAQCEEHLLAQQQEVQEIQHKMLQRVQQQEEYQLRKKIEEHCLPEVLAHTTQALEKKFSDPQYGQRYVHRVMQTLDKGAA